MSTPHLLHLLCAAYMTGVIWFVQLVQYPMLKFTDGHRDSAAGHREYTRRMGFVVMPVMLGELLFQGLELFQDPGNRAWLTSFLLLLIWASTFLLQVPRNHRLTRGYDAGAHRSLVRTNWIRTVAWTSRALLLGFWM
jgi:hypothetical protein